MQGFLGLAIFYRRSVKGSTGIAKPLTNLSKINKYFIWRSEEEATFKRLKKNLTSAPILQVFDKDKPHEVWVDVSDYAVGAILVQQDDDSK